MGYASGSGSESAHFKRVPMGHPVIMGRKTFDSTGRALPKRRNIVVTRNPGWRHEGVEVAHSIDEAIAPVGDEPASIIGGAQVFAARCLWPTAPWLERLVPFTGYASSGHGFGDIARRRAWRRT